MRRHGVSSPRRFTFTLVGIGHSHFRSRVIPLPTVLDALIGLCVAPATAVIELLVLVSTLLLNLVLWVVEIIVRLFNLESSLEEVRLENDETSHTITASTFLKGSA